MTRRRRAGNDPGERGRFSARRKTEAVLRLLRGEDVDSLSRELGVTAATLASWRDHFLAGGQTALKSRPSDAHDEEVLRLRAKVGELMMGNELLEQRAKRAEGDLGPFVAAEVETLGRSSSASAGRADGVERVCRYLGIPRSSLYSRLARESAPPPVAQKRGPKTYSDAELTDSIRQAIATSPTIFVAVDHCSSECIGLPASKPGTRFEALEPLRQGLLEHFGSYREQAAIGLAVRHDHGSQFMSDYYQDELRFLGIESSPAFVRQPEGNGCVEHFIRVLKEQLLWTRWFETIEDLRLALLAFQRTLQPRVAGRASRSPHTRRDPRRN